MAEKYTKEVLEPLVRESFTITEVLKKLGIENYSGGMSNHIHSKIKKFKIDTSHFLGSRANSGARWKGPVKAPEEILVRLPAGSNRKQAASLRKALLRIGRAHQCEECQCGSSWRNRSLVLEIDHINGDRLDNRKENLRFLCPNCHSQTDTFGTKNMGS